MRQNNQINSTKLPIPKHEKGSEGIHQAVYHMRMEQASKAQTLRQTTTNQSPTTSMARNHYGFYCQVTTL